MKYRPYTGHLLRRRSVESRYAAIGDRRLNRHGIQQAWKMKVSRVLRLSAHLQGTINAGRVATNGRSGQCFLFWRHVRSFAESDFHGQSEGVRETTFGQLDLECVFALWFRIANGGLGCLSED